MKFLHITTFLLSFLATSYSQCPPVPQDGDVKKAYSSMVYGIEHFSLALLRELYATDSKSSGIFFSAFSIWSALSLVYMGSKGETERQLSYLLGTDERSKSALMAAYKNLQDSWKSKMNSTNNILRLVNRIDFAKQLSIDQCFFDLPAEIKEIDFTSDPEAARQDINTWVSEATNNKIKELIPSGYITPITRLVIANAVYFKGNWMNKFDKKFTTKRPFRTSNLSILYKDTMYQRGSFYYGISDNLQWSMLELPYSGKDFSMIIILPRNYVTGLKNLIGQLTPELLGNLLGSMFYREVTVFLPKFKVESSFELSSTLQNMGLKDLFNPGKSDLSGFTGANDLAVDEAFHKSYIDVSEEGTEAAAATGILASRTARLDGPATFIADRPFLYMIKDNLLNVILFMGTIEKPEL